MDMAQVVG